MPCWWHAIGGRRMARNVTIGRRGGGRNKGSGLASLLIAPFLFLGPTSALAADCAQFIQDLNYPDGTARPPGQTINKGWRLKNCGDTTWSGYTAVRISGSFGPTSFSVPTVPPAVNVYLCPTITVPTTPGTHRATYRLSGPQGQLGDPFWVDVVVQSQPTNDCAQFIQDLNYPDGTVVSPGQTINKGWRVKNCGDTTWSGYTAVRISGSFGPTSFSVPTVPTGVNVDLYTNITVPTTAGTHRATYKLSGPGGQFGDPFWVEVVVQSQPTNDCAQFIQDLNTPA